MSSANVSKAALVVGWVLSALAALLLMFSAMMKFAKPPSVVKGFGDFGYPERLLVPLGILELSCAVIYLFPRTAVLGAILVTGYLGGAVATSVRIERGDFILPRCSG